MTARGGRKTNRRRVLSLVVAGLSLLAAGATAQETGMLAERPVQTVEGDVNRPDHALNIAALRVGSDSSLVHAGGAAVMSNWEALRIGMTVRRMVPPPVSITRN